MMSYTPFYELFPELASRETRVLTVMEPGVLPLGRYVWLETYCNEPGCDCRRVFFSVLLEETEQVLAVIAYGWESLGFYAKWMGDDSPEILKDLKGPILNLVSPQSQLAPALLRVTDDLILTDELFVERLKTHYQMFKEVVDKKQKKKKAKGKRIQRKSRTKRAIRSKKK